MLYTEFKVGEQEFKLRATASAIIELEKKLGGRNPLQVLMTVENGEIPSVSSLLLILHASLQKYHHGMTFEKVLELYDDYVDAGNSYTDLIPVMVDTFRTSGFFKTVKKEEAATITASL
ncbi:hypothetical protein CSE16_11920 [Solibacillus sp. R5-41]|uniref:DUF6096 family protein n=1 Tax=Solibacillus sp. R5-41 TaxID=2048654 RepID=UPI000C1250CE|nr:DUF6096 family protein [Solibacillus sp. R5-41]ATP40698.1 hypothetical protein CSE16_11920 [Solibacillus sp. R5-41]